MADIVGILKKAYFFFEDRYYGVLDRVNKAIPVYKAVDPIDKVVPSFALLLAFIVLVAGFFAMISFSVESFKATVKVVDNKGEPIEGVSIGLDLPGLPEGLSTDETGSIELDLPESEAEADLALSKEGFEDLNRLIVLVADEILSITMQPVLDPVPPDQSEKTVKVRDSGSNMPITKEVTLSFECTRGGSPPVSQTGSTGEFTVMQQSNCPVLVATAEADGYLKRSKTLFSKLTTIYLEEDIPATKGSINVSVRDTAGNAVPDAAVRALDEVMDTEAASGSTTLAGTLLLQDLQPGNYTISVIMPDGRTGQETAVSVTAGEITRVDVTLPTAAQATAKKIYLKLVEQGTSNPVADAQALIYNDGIFIDSTASDSLGIVDKAISNPNSDYKVVIMHPDFVTKLEPGIPLKSLSDSDPIAVPMVRASMEQPSPTSGEIIVKVVDEALDPVEDAVVSIYYSSHPGVSLKRPHGRSLEDGTYTFENLGKGTYLAKSEDEDGMAEGSSGNITLAVGQSQQAEVMLVLGEGSVEAEVIDEGSGNPISGAVVEFIDANGSQALLASCTTDSKGKCSSEPIKADRYVFVKASATDFVTGFANSRIDIVNKNRHSVSIGLIPGGSIPAGTGSFDASFKHFCEERTCKKPASRIKSDSTNTKTYFAKFELIFAQDLDYTGTVYHVRLGPDSEIELPLPNDYNIKVENATGPLFTSAPLSKCWNNDSGNPFTEPKDCQAGNSAKQANVYYPNLAGKQVVPVVIEFTVEPGLADGTKLEMHYMAKSTVSGNALTTAQKVKYFLVDEVLCDGKEFAWDFILASPDGSISLLDSGPGRSNQAALNESYDLNYRVYNCSKENLASASITAESKPPELKAISFTEFEPFNTGPINAYKQDAFAFRADTLVSNTLPIYPVAETELADLEFVLSSSIAPSIEAISFSISSSKQLALTLVPNTLPPFGRPDLSGRVREASGTGTSDGPPIAGAHLSLKLPGDRAMSTRSDGNGFFTIRDIAGLHGLSDVNIVVRKAGYAILEERIEVGFNLRAPNANILCVTIEKDGISDVNLHFDKSNSSSDTFDTFIVKNGCLKPVKIELVSELEFRPLNFKLTKSITLAAGAQREAEIFSKTWSEDAFRIAIGEYAVYVNAKFVSDGDTVKFGNVRTARVFVTDSTSPFRLANPASPSNPNTMKSTFNVSEGSDTGLIVNKDFVYFNDSKLPRLEKARDISPAEKQYSLEYQAPSQAPVEFQRQRIFGSNESPFSQDNKLVVEVADNAGYVKLEWVDFFMTDKNHFGGDRHRVFATVPVGDDSSRSGPENVTDVLPFIEAVKGPIKEYYNFMRPNRTTVEKVRDARDPAYPHVDSAGWVDIDVYYPEDIVYNTELTDGPVWQGQHNICNNNAGGIDTDFRQCLVKDSSGSTHFGGQPITPYKVGFEAANKIILEIDPPPGKPITTEITGMKWLYTSTDKSHDGKMDFEIVNNSLAGESFAMIEVEDTTGVQYVSSGSSQGGIAVDWILSATVSVKKDRKITQHDYESSSRIKLPAGSTLGVSVDEGRTTKYQVFDSAASLDSVYNAFRLVIPKEVSSVFFKPRKKNKYPTTNPYNVSFQAYYGGSWSQPQSFDVTTEIGEDGIVLDLPPTLDVYPQVEVIAFKNNSTKTIEVDKIELNYLVSGTDEIELKKGQLDILPGKYHAEYDLVGPLPPLPQNASVHYDLGSLEYRVSDTTPNALVYFSDTKMASSSNPAGAKIVAVSSSPQQERFTHTERFHVRLVGPSQEQCLVSGGLVASTGPESKPRVLFDWGSNSIDIDTCSYDNPDFVYCDPTQFTLSLVKRLFRIKELESQGLSENLLKIRALQSFKVYLIEDAYTPDFRNDFVDSYQGEFFSLDLLDSDQPWGLYLKDLERFDFNTVLAAPNSSEGPGSKLVEAGLHEVYLDFNFSKADFDFFDDQGDDIDLLSYITVHLKKLKDPLIKNPFYYLPFNGNVGIDDDSVFHREGYGLVFENNDRPLAIFIEPVKADTYDTATVSGGARKIVETSETTDFDSINGVAKGKILDVGQDQREITFSPSIATPVIMGMISANGKAEAYYWIRDEQGNPLAPTAEMRQWTAAGSDTRFGGACLDYGGNPIVQGPTDGPPQPGSCTTDPNSYGITYPAAEDGKKLFLETVFYSPAYLDTATENSLRKSCENGSMFYSLNEQSDPPSLYRTDTLSMGIPLNVGNEQTNVRSFENIVDLIGQEYVCVLSGDTEFTFWWNTEKVLSELDAAKLLIDSDWQYGMDCNAPSS